MLEVKSFVSRYARRLFFFAADEARPAGMCGTDARSSVT